MTDIKMYIRWTAVKYITNIVVQEQELWIKDLQTLIFMKHYIFNFKKKK
jgi:hypothetical protein